MLPHPVTATPPMVFLPQAGYPPIPPFKPKNCVGVMLDTESVPKPRYEPVN